MACNIIQDWHKIMIRSVQPNNHWNQKMYTYTVIVWLHRSDHVFVPILNNITRIFKINQLSGRSGKQNSP